MPEGDTIHKAAAKLRPALEGATLVRFEAARAAGSMPRPGTTITAVEARGKYLILRFADGHVLQTHLKMTGRWDLYREGERWRRPAHLARAVIAVDGYVAVCFSAPVVRVIRVKPDAADPLTGQREVAPDAAQPDAVAPGGGGAEGGQRFTWNWIDAATVGPLASPAGLRADATGFPALADEAAKRVRSKAAPIAAPPLDGAEPADGTGPVRLADEPGASIELHRDQRFASLDHLGPDLCLADVDLDAAVARMDTVATPGDDIADVLLDQRVAAGIGNVYKSEVLWACRLHPLTPLAGVDRSLRRQLLETAAKLLQANLTTRRRTTVPGPAGSVAVYNRSRRPCRRCGTPIRWARTGRDHRSTYWCPRCQPPVSAVPSPGSPGVGA